jgi:hypothetical protein
MPVDAQWKMANSSGYAVSFAQANADVFNEAVRASRWASMLFGLLLVGAGVWWAQKWAGAMAGGLAGIALALNPNLIAHGNLCTTDMGVTALVFAGTAVLWKACRDESRGALVLATVLFMIASLTKFTGLIWLASALFVVVPVLSRRWRSKKILWLIPVSVVALIGMLLMIYGPEAQAIRDLTPKGVKTLGKLPAGRFIEGLMLQSRHALEGHTAWFHGDLFEKSTWWHMPAAIVLKSPEVWLAGVCLAFCAFAAGVMKEVRGQKSEIRKQVSASLLPFVPALVFAFLLFFVNNMAIGVRHALPLVALGSIAIAVAVARIANGRVRNFAALTFTGGMIFAAGSGFPNYIAYFPVWAGGEREGHRWLVDSNYDWGQGLDELEGKWAQLTAENGGVAPNLIYYGFVDPRLTHRMVCGPQSSGGFMDAALNGAKVQERMKNLNGTFVISRSALELQPFGLNLESLHNAKYVGRVGACFEMYRFEKDGAAQAKSGNPN